MLSKKISYRDGLPYSGIPILVLIVLMSKNVSNLTLLGLVVVTVMGYIASVVDIKTLTIPNKIPKIMISLWVLLTILRLFMDFDYFVIAGINSLLGLLIGGGTFFLIYKLSKGKMGGGDVKLMAVFGLYLGIIGSITTMMYASILVLLVSGILMLIKKVNRATRLPFAPFLYVGSLIYIFAIIF